MTYALAFVLAFCSIAYELLIAKSVARLCGDPMLWESVSIGVFVLGMGAGALSKVPESLNERLLRLARFELMLSIAGGASTAIILYLHMAYRIYGYDEGLLRDQMTVPPVYVFGAAAQLVTLMIGALTGVELPALMEAPLGHRRPPAMILAAYYLGTLAGTVVTATTLLHAGNGVTAAVAVAALNLLAALTIFAMTRAPRQIVAGVGAAGVVAAALAALTAYAPRLLELHLGNVYYNRYAWSATSKGEAEVFFPVGIRELPGFLEDYPKVRRFQSAYQQIDLVPNAASPLSDAPEEESEGLSLYIDGRFQISTATADAYHQALAHVPVMTRATPPKRILVLGAGDGLLAHELLRYGDAIDSITLVEIDPEVLRLAREEAPLRMLNGGALDSPKLTVIVDDAFRYLRASEATFDAVYMDLTFPFEFESARLYSAEFLGLTARVLADDGFLALPSPVDFTTDEGQEWERLVHSTFHAAGYRRLLAYRGTRDAFLLAVKQAGVLAPGASRPLFPLTALPADPFAGDAARELTGEFDPELVHTLLKPKLIRMPDPFF